MRMHKTIAGHQPNFAPYAGFFYKMRACDEFILHDNMKVSSGEDAWQKEQRILDWLGEIELRVPIKRTDGAVFTDAIINESSLMGHAKIQWREYHLARLKVAYGINSVPDMGGDSDYLTDRLHIEDVLSRQVPKRKRIDAPFFNKYYHDIARIYRIWNDRPEDADNREQQSLWDFNLRIISYLRDTFSISTPLIEASALKIDLSPLIGLEHNIAMRGPSQSKKEIIDVINHLRSFEPDYSFQIPLDKAADMIIDEYIDTIEGRIKCPDGRPKRIKLAATARIVRCCQELSADTHLAGLGSKVYSLDSLFKVMEIKNEYFTYELEPYEQIHTPYFVPALSAFDYLFNTGGLP